MSFQVICPTDPKHNRFEVTASVQEIWEVDRDGTFQSVIDTGPDVSHRPDSQDLYTCLACGSQATVQQV